ncbi:serine protease [Aquabacter sp. CN5-332]|uniref:S1 family peptidase n=1 Tax=Aquabacter sp. CN5-332 TaxID=3156608 RepID=UPI0032B3C027
MALISNRMFKAVSRRVGLTLAFVAAGLAAAHAAPPAKSTAPALTVDGVLLEADGWKIGISASLGGCFAGATFDNDTTLWLGLGGKQERGFLVVTNPVWNQLQTGQLYDMKVSTPGQAGWRGKAMVVERGNDEKGFLISDLKDEMMGSFARAESIEFQLDNRAIAQLPLTASPSAIAHVIKCQSRFAQLLAEVQAEGKPKGASNGTGFFVSWGGHILTNHHVVDGCKVLEVRRPGSAPVPARLVADDATNDLALLQTSLRTRELPALVTRARIGQGVFVYGFPLTPILSSAGNFTSGGVSAMTGIGDDTSRLQISAPIQPGNSGGPVIDQNGNVLGVVASTLGPLGGETPSEKPSEKPAPQNANFAIKASAAATFLEANGVEPVAKVLTAALDPAAVAERAKEFTVRVECDFPR